MSDDKKVTVGDLREHSLDELTVRERTLREQLFAHKMARFTNQIEDTMQIKKTRRDIARVQTIMSERRTAPKGKE